MGKTIRSIGLGFACVTLFAATGCVGTASDTDQSESSSEESANAPVAPGFTLSDEQRAEVQANADPKAAQALADSFRANPGAFRDVSACESMPEANSAEGIGEASQAISWSCRLVNYGNPLWWQLVAVIAGARATTGLTWGNCNWIVDRSGELASWYGLPFVPLAGWSGRCACTYVYE